jgi:Tfp pilus assembly PilM family ATPase
LGKQVAIEITTDAVHVIEGEFKKNNIIIHDVVDLPAPRLLNGEVDNFDEIIESLLEYYDEKNGKKMSVNVMFPSKSLSNQLMQIPMIDEKALKKTMPSYIQEQFGGKDKTISTLTHCSDFAVYGDIELEKSRQLVVLMSVLGKDISLRCVDAFNKQKYRVKVIDTPVNNLYYVSEIIRQKREPLDMVIQLMNNETNILFFQKNKPVFHRYLKFGVQNMKKDQKSFFDQIFRTIAKYNQDFKGQIKNVALVGEASHWFGTQGTFQEVFENSGMDVKINEWTVKSGDFYQSANLTISNETERDLDTTYISTIGLLAREVI